MGGGLGFEEEGMVLPVVKGGVPESGGTIVKLPEGGPGVLVETEEVMGNEDAVICRKTVSDTEVTALWLGFKQPEMKPRVAGE